MVRPGHCRFSMLTGGKAAYLVAGFFNMASTPGIDALACFDELIIANTVRQAIAFYRHESIK